ncbi:50S ribosomal protein L6, chloroplastic-like, partial [Diospyros lotus]|uniref:50S ribosomal protein L6, chloroplastic-like n=1 Tax=Diospyros lotus TaxID=55363 RepID=UPI0022542FB4
HVYDPNPINPNPNPLNFVSCRVVSCRVIGSCLKLPALESGVLRVRKAAETRQANQMHGLFGTLTYNMVVGVSKGFEKRLQLVGVGYRAMLEGKDLVLSLGFSHPVRMQIPDGLQVKVEDNTRIAVSGYDKSAIGQFAASIRKWRPPEPYKKHKASVMTSV